MKYTVIIEKEKNSYGAYVPDLPGCVAAAKTEHEVVNLISEAIELHLEDIRHSGHRPPRPVAKAELVEV